mmetsp:Transcript_18671/g.27638  ORF Transcript_18671/g.27638 Transcript_18671/m.27638 type:complete len:167 (+) Transcript_18671:60-560(+)|eukprot:CAMPEP_0194201176 /NCGR_PEP_ID=MMETSP0156-20130528/1519_1 /TAXON_ID=33649 /ORGANISM="Thalassionema nitzschioides, Strain L26-B" /LENGTH=166 /DNA_ID=CAMNT_0038926305 /DNA_START=59 /DNA_END=559 /DNA_ORIENTATION=-
MPNFGKYGEQFNSELDEVGRGGQMDEATAWQQQQAELSKVRSDLYDDGRMGGPRGGFTDKGRVAKPVEWSTMAADKKPKVGKPFKTRGVGSYAISTVADGGFDSRKDKYNLGDANAFSWVKGQGRGLIAPPNPRTLKTALTYYTLVAPDGRLILKPVDNETGTAEC